MPFIREILRHRSVAIVGLEKNTGKTECLNYVLRHLPRSGVCVAVTSIGIDGERTDSLTGGVKPTVRIDAGTIFSTSERFLGKCGTVAEILDVSDESTAVGRIVTARALTAGDVLLIGASSSTGLARWMEGLERFDVKLTLVDGALSRMSSASPTVTDAMILATGASYSKNIETLVKRTAYAVEKITAPAADTSTAAKLCDISDGIWAIGEDGGIEAIGPKSGLLASEGIEIPAGCRAVYIAGALTDSFAGHIMTGKNRPKEIVVQDFTKIFLTQPVWRRYAATGGRLTALRRSHLIAVCVNPTAHDGTGLCSDELCEKIAAATGVPTYDIVKNINVV